MTASDGGEGDEAGEDHLYKHNNITFNTKISTKTQENHCIFTETHKKTKKYLNINENSRAFACWLVLGNKFQKKKRDYWVVWGEDESDWLMTRQGVAFPFIWSYKIPK